MVPDDEETELAESERRMGTDGLDEIYRHLGHMAETTPIFFRLLELLPSLKSRLSLELPMGAS